MACLITGLAHEWVKSISVVGISHSVWARWQQRIEDSVNVKPHLGVQGGFIPVRLRAGATASMTPVTGLQIELTLTSGHRMHVQGMDEQQLLSLIQRLVT